MEPDPISEQPSTNQWRRGYEPAGSVHDEMLSMNGSAPRGVRPHWQTFVSLLDRMAPLELSRRWELGQRLIHENAVTYNVYGEVRGLERPWELDAIPLLISPEEWNGLESALLQRAHLLNLILQDLYGSQALLRAGVLPPELVFAHPGFLRPCHGIRLPNHCNLNLYAADIGRSSDGRWSVMGDRTQAPAGAGYALENRIVLSRVFPDVFKNCQIQRLALFFRKLRETLASLAPYNRDNPRIVLLTSGPLNETYFEHAYLARYLNYTLVEGGDLTVRDQCVFLKTLGGLHRVDVILRRLDAEYCDPLELRADSTLGVPGLVQAARAGNVAIANPLGSGLVETPAIIPFLPALSRYLLNEDLKMPSVPSWWCGVPTGLQHVLANLPRMVIKAAFPSREIQPVFAARLSAQETAELAARIKAKPHLYVAQEQVALSMAPVLVKDRIEPRHVVVRTYLAASENSYIAMPGGLTQVPSAADTLIFSLQRGGGSKDTWVQSSGPVSNFTLLRGAGASIELSRGGGDLPSRVADNLFWLGRYVERAESTVRLLRAITVRLSDKSALGEVRELPDLLRAMRRQRIGYAGAPSGLTDELPQQDEFKLLLDESFADGGLYSTLKSLQDVARLVRDRLSTDTWRVIRSLDQDTVWPRIKSDADLSEALTSLNFMVITLASFGGLASESMTRGQVWLFMDMGRRLERAINIAGLLRSTLVRSTTDDGPLLEAVLEIADSFMTYRRRYLSSLQVGPLLDLLLADETNPRSLAFQFLALNEHVESLPRDPSVPHLTPEQRIVLGGLSALRLTEIERLCQSSETGSREDLDKLLSDLTEQMIALSDAITRQYLSHAQTSRQLASLRTEGL